MLVTVRDRILDQPLHVSRGREDVVETFTRGCQRMAAAQSRVHEIARPRFILQSLPERGAAVSLHRFDADFASTPPLHHALDRLESMEVVAVHTSVAHGQCFANARPQRHFDRRCSPGHREAGTSHQRSTDFPCRVVDFLSPVPVPRKMLVVEYRYSASAVTKYFVDLLEELVAGILDLALFVSLILAVLADDDDSVNGQLASAQGQSFGDARAHFHRGKS